jgi:hypothetical protein
VAIESSTSATEGAGFVCVAIVEGWLTTPLFGFRIYFGDVVVYKEGHDPLVQPLLSGAEKKEIIHLARLGIVPR